MHNQSQEQNIKYVRFEVFAAVTMKNSVFYNVTLCGSSKNRRSSEKSILTIATWRNIPEDGILRNAK
jgi:hypothetical protein